MNKNTIAIKKMMRFPARTFWKWGVGTLCMNTCECSEMITLSIEKGRAWLEKSHRTWECNFFGGDQRVVDSLISWKTSHDIDWFEKKLKRNGLIMNMM